MALIAQVVAQGEEQIGESQEPQEQSLAPVSEQLPVVTGIKATRPGSRGMFSASVGLFALLVGALLEVRPSAGTTTTFSALALTLAAVLAAWLARPKGSRWLELGTWPLVAPLSLGMAGLAVFDTSLALEMIPAGLQASGALALLVGAWRWLDARLTLNPPKLAGKRKWQVVRDEGAKPIKVPSADLLPGDVLELSSGQIVPADGRLTAEAGTVDERLIAGRRLVVEKGPGDAVLAGSKVLSPRLCIRLVAPPSGSFLKRRETHLRTIADGFRSADRVRQLSAVGVGLLSLTAASLILYFNWADKNLEFLLPALSGLFLAGAAGAPALAKARAQLDALRFTRDRGVIVARAQDVLALGAARGWYVDPALLAAPGQIRVAAFGGMDQDGVLSVAEALLTEEVSPPAISIRAEMAHRSLEPLRPAALRRTQAIFHGTVDGARWLLGPRRALHEEDDIRPDDAAEEGIDGLRGSFDVIWVLARPDRGVVGALGIAFGARDDIAAGARELGASLLPGLPDLQRNALAKAAGISPNAAPLKPRNGSLLHTASAAPSAGLSVRVVEGPDHLVAADLSVNPLVLSSGTEGWGKLIGAVGRRLRQGRRWAWLSALVPVPVAFALTWVGVTGPLLGAGLAALALGLAARSSHELGLTQADPDRTSHEPDGSQAEDVVARVED